MSGNCVPGTSRLPNVQKKDRDFEVPQQLRPGEYHHVGTPYRDTQPEEKPNGPSALSQWERDLGLTAASGKEWYKGSSGLEACEVVEQFALPYHLGEVVCHVLRAGRKPGVLRRSDLQNALWHLQRELSRAVD